MKSKSAFFSFALIVALFASGCGQGYMESEELVGAEETGTLSDELSTSVPIGSTLVTTAAVNLRKGPATTYAVILVVPSGAKVKTVERTSPSAGWYKVNYSGKVGWIYGTYLKLAATSTLSQKVLARAAGIAPHNRPYVFNGVQDCYGYVRQVWNAILFDGSVHSEDYYPNSYNKSRWLGVSAGLPVGDYPSSNWVYFSSPSELIPGDVLSTHQGHAWGASWHGGIYAGVSNGQHRIWDNSGSWNGAYNRPFYYGFHYYYRPTHQKLASSTSTAPTTPTTPKFTTEYGTFTASRSINVRTAPSSSATITGTLSAGQSINYDSYYNDGRYTWVHYISYSGAHRYLVVREYGTPWGTFR